MIWKSQIHLDGVLTEDEQEAKEILDEAFLQVYPHCKQVETCRASLSKKCVCPKPPKENYTRMEVLNILNIICPIAAEHGKNNTYFDPCVWFNKIKQNYKL